MRQYTSWRKRAAKTYSMYAVGHQVDANARSAPTGAENELNKPLTLPHLLPFNTLGTPSNASLQGQLSPTKSGVMGYHTAS